MAAGDVTFRITADLLEGATAIAAELPGARDSTTPLDGTEPWLDAPTN